MNFTQWKWLLCIMVLLIGLQGEKAARGDEISLNEIKPENVLEYSLSVIEPIEKRYSQLPSIHFIKGYAFYRAQRYQKAIEAFEKGLEIRSDFPEITQMVAFMYSKHNEHEKAIEWYKKTLELDPTAERANERLGQELEKLNRNEEAMKAYQRELENYPEDASSRVYLGELYFDQGELEEAKKQAQWAMKYEPILPEPHYLMAKIYRKEGDQEAAEECLEIFKQKKVEEQEYLEQEESESVDDLKKAKQSAAQLHMDLALIIDKSDSPDQAKKHYQKVLSLSPKNLMARYNLAKIYHSQKHYEKAEMMYRELLALKSDDPRFLNGLGMMLGSQKKWEEALQYFEKALRFDKESVIAKRGMATVYLNLGRNPSKTLSLMEDVVHDEHNAENYNLLGWAYFANGMIEKSLEAMETAMDLDPNNSVYKRRHAQIKARMR